MGKAMVASIQEAGKLFGSMVAIGKDKDTYQKAVNDFIKDVSEWCFPPVPLGHTTAGD
jgi:hypothetical protein